MKVASLLPAATEIVCALGLRQSLVARSHCCDHPADVASVPALTRARVDRSLPGKELDEQVRELLRAGTPLYDLDQERLSELRPDVVVTQEACEVCAVSYGQVQQACRASGVDSTIVSLRPTRLGHILEDVEAVARACGIPETGAALVSRLRERLARVRKADEPRVLVVEWLDPPMLGGHWIPEAVAAAGGLPLGPGPGEASPTSTWDEMAALRADAVVVAACGFDLRRTLAESEPHLSRLRGLAARVLLLDGDAYLNRPGPRMVDAVEILAGWLRGEGAPSGAAVDLPS